MPNVLLAGLILCALAVFIGAVEGIVVFHNIRAARARSVLATFENQFKLTVAGFVAGLMALAGLGCIVIHVATKLL